MASMFPFRTLLRLSRPLNVLLAALTYLLGAGISQYLGAFKDQATFWLGFGGIVAIQFSMALLAEAFRPVVEPAKGEENKSLRVAIRNAALFVALGTLAISAAFFLLLTRVANLAPAALFFLGLSLIVVLIYGVPPLRLVNAGFGEFLLSVHLALIAPALGFVLQAGSYHRLVAIVSFPLILLALAYFLVQSFPTFTEDQKFDRRTLLRSMSWERAIPFHHGIVLGAYLLLAAALRFGLAWDLVWPAFLTFPFAVLQILWLRNISLGAKPMWRLLTVNALAVYGVTTYLLTFAFWLR